MEWKFSLLFYCALFCLVDHCKVNGKKVRNREKNKIKINKKGIDPIRPLSPEVSMTSVSPK